MSQLQAAVERKAHNSIPDKISTMSFASASSTSSSGTSIALTTYRLPPIKVSGLAAFELDRREPIALALGLAPIA